MVKKKIIDNVKTSKYLAFILLLLGSEVSLADVVLSHGGSNYVAFDLNPDLLVSSDDWKNSKIFIPPHCTFSKNREGIKRDLSAMSSNGQKKLALVIWHAHMDIPQSCAGFLVKSIDGKLPEEVIQNLVGLITLAHHLQYDEVNVRFAPMAQNKPSEWRTWEEVLFEENWSTIQSTLKVLNEVSGIKIVYDLGVEIGGVEEAHCNQCSQYVRRLWSLYSKEFPVEQSVGFSIAYAPGRLGRLIEELGEGNVAPKVFAIDIYKKPIDIEKAISLMAREANDHGIKNPIFKVQETYYADSEVYSAIVHSAKENNVSIESIMQWPQVRGSKKKHISVPNTYKYIYQPQ